MGTAIVVFLLALKGFLLRIDVLSDAFSTAGLLLILSAGLLLVSGEGMFLGLGYALKNALTLFIPAVRKAGETYPQYRRRKAEKEKPRGQGAVFVTGVFFLAVGILFLMIWLKQS